MIKIVDTHAHYDDKSFNSDRDQVLSGLSSFGVVGVINAAQDLATAKFASELSKKYPFLYSTVGIHPHNASGCTDEVMAELALIAKENEKVVAVGETGLDYHYNYSTPDEQMISFEKNIDLAMSLGLPLVLHSREASENSLKVIKERNLGRHGAVMHCYSGSREMAKILAKEGLYFSLGGVVTYKTARNVIEALEVIPDDQLMLETDCPYLTPVPFRNKRNDSSMLKYTAEKIAQIKGMEYERLLEITTKNAEDFYRIKF